MLQILLKENKFTALLHLTRAKENRVI
jgi:hypothetical protein